MGCDTDADAVCSLITVFTKVNSKKVNFMVTGKCHGVMVGGTKEIGFMVRWMGMAKKYDPMVAYDTKANGGKGSQFGSRPRAVQVFDPS